MSSILKKRTVWICSLLALLVLLPKHSFAQGCILTRNMSPVLGAQLSPYLQKGEMQFATSYRQFTADTQYQRTDLSQPVTQNNTQVISKMRYVELSGAYAINPEWNLTVAVPLIVLASSNRALPSTVPGSPRFTQSTTGFGDMLFGMRHWFMKCDSNPDRNFSIGVGVKAPTGDSNAHDLFPNAQGLDIRDRVVDQSIQLGDGGWGFYLSSEGFKQYGNWSVFGSGIYMFNPRTQNETLSPRSMLAPAGPQAIDPKERYNTVSDSYLVRGGVGYPIPGMKGTAGSIAARIEGVPVNDVFGATNGFRRPGYYFTFEPGVNYSAGRTTLSLTVPIRAHQNVKDSLGFRRDSTFADHVILMSLTYRFRGNYETTVPAAGQ